LLKLLRHGEAVGNAQGVLLGRMDSPLTENGERQVSRLKTLLGPDSQVKRVISSPLLRARKTAEALDLGVEIEIDERWTEVDYGTFDGQKLTDMPAEIWQAWRSDPTYRPPQGETLAELGERVRSACNELFANSGLGTRAHEDVVVVSHVSPIKAAVSWALGSGDELAWRLWLATASMTVIGWGADTPVLHRYNLVVPSEAHPSA
jgi:probable phosphoglycerate mutase